LLIVIGNSDEVDDEFSWDLGLVYPVDLHLVWMFTAIFDGRYFVFRNSYLVRTTSLDEIYFTSMR
jgi:hypothetical protein